MVFLSPAMSLLLVISMGLLCPSNSHTFYVGGDDGWTLHPSMNYSRWAERYRFLINDELVFKYKKGHDSVLVVNHNDYSKCNKENPIRALKDGDSCVFRLAKSGPFFFISGHDQNCEKGQKLNIVVLSPHHHIIAPSQPSNRTTTVKPPSTPPISHHAPPFSSLSPKTPANLPPLKPPSRSPSPSPVHLPPVKPPAHSPSLSPAAKTPAHAPITETPSHSPSPSPGAKIPTHAPPTKTPSHSSSPSPAASTKSSHSIYFSGRQDSN